MIEHPAKAQGCAFWETHTEQQMQAEQQGGENSRRTATAELSSLARRPVFDLERRSQGCQLWSEIDALRSAPDDVAMVRRAIHTAVNVIGLDRFIDEGHILFLRVVPETLIEEDYSLLPPGRTVLVIDAGAEAPDGLLDACTGAKEQGYALAVNETEAASCERSLMAAAEMVAVDVASPRLPEVSAEAKEARATLLATNVETPEAFATAKEYGADLVQGYFFCCPEPTSGASPAGLAAVHQRLLIEANRRPTDPKRLEEIIKSDVALSYHLLRHINSPAFAVREQVTSIPLAMHLLGERRLQRWCNVTVVSALALDKPHEVLVTSLVRSRFCEGVVGGTKHDERAPDLFLAGLMSTMDAIMDTPMEQAVDCLPINDEIRAGLLAEPSSFIGQVLTLSKACERGAWSTAGGLCSTLGVSQREVAQRYYEALGWARELVRG
jgi:EAL and modified HD-GYP domain-containing signal transduction protein